MKEFLERSTFKSLNINLKTGFVAKCYTYLITLLTYLHKLHILHIFYIQIDR